MSAASPPPREAAALLARARDAVRAGRIEEAAQLLSDCLNLAPGFIGARQEYAMVLHRLSETGQALQQIGILLRDDPSNVAYLEFQANALGKIGDYTAALVGYEAILSANPANPAGWLRYGHLLKTAGRTPEAITAYRKSLSLRSSGEAWWSLANLRTVTFSDADIAAMRGALGTASADDRIQLHFALGRALEDRGDYAVAFAHYEQGNAGQRRKSPYRPEEMHNFVERATSVFSQEFFAGRAGHGCDARAPIFVVGLPRSGSTLIEQILASHSAVEGTMELFDMIALARTVRGTNTDYATAIADFDVGRLRGLGEDYLARTKPYRRLDRPFFIDKMPNNFIHTALIHLVLPNARIIDVRRDPLDCGISVFKQFFAAGQEFSYGLSDIGHYYADYVRLMAHFDSVLPGRVHRVIYEELVAHPEREIRNLLAYCGLPFEDSCMQFHENTRPVRTPSAEQVRRPLFRDSIESWRHFDPWLGPLKAALGTELTESRSDA